MRNRTWLFVAIPVILILVGGGIFAASRLSRPSTAYALVTDTTLSVLKGTAQLQRADGSRATVLPGPGNDTTVRAGDRIETGADSYAVVTYFDGSTTEIEPSTNVTIQKLDRLPGGGVNISLSQQVGQTWNRVEKLVDANSRFETTTSSAVAYVRGTA